MKIPSPTHPWIDFRFELSALGPDAWVLLGEAMSKCEHLIGSPLKPSVADHLSSVYVAKGVHATTAIEGNTLSEAQVLERVQGTVDTLPQSREYLGIEVDNIIRAVGEIDQAVGNGVVLPLSTDRLLELHATVLFSLNDPPENEPGKTRRHNVGVARYSAPDHSQVDGLLESLFEWLDELRAPTDARSSDRFVASVLLAVLAHLYIAWIHPFGNGNGRTARLVEVQILAQSGLVPLVATNLLSDHYNKTRERYYVELERASAARDVSGFVHYAVEGFVEELREQVKTVKSHNVQVAWESYIHEMMTMETNSEAKSRQRRVALRMPFDRYISRDEVIELTPRIAADYAVRGFRTPARDLNELVRMGLVEKRGRGYRARMEVIRAFTSPVASGITPLLPHMRQEPASLLDLIDSSD